jgi:hypothetical protein
MIRIQECSIDHKAELSRLSAQTDKRVYETSRLMPPSRGDLTEPLRYKDRII